MEAILNYPHFWEYVSMPFISAIVGWGTNWLAIKMMFVPLEFVGIPPFLGWQGIVPAKAEKMSRLSVGIITARLLNPKELFARLQPDKVTATIEPMLRKLTEQIVSRVMEEQSPTLWESLPSRAKEEIFRRVDQRTPDVVPQIMSEIQEHIEELLDIEEMVVREMVRDKSLICDMFIKVSGEELKFIVRSGFYFGFLFGLIQTGIWVFWQEWWLLPVGGLLVGYITNWLAMEMIFKPKEPVKIGPFTFQGMLLKRQLEVSKEFGKMTTEKLLTSRNLMESIIRGPAADKLFTIMQRHIKNAIDDQGGIAKPFIVMVVGTDNYIAMKDRAVSIVMETLPAQVDLMQGYATKALDIENTLVSRMSALPPSEFEAILHPPFQEDEWILIVVGAVLGLLVGIGQLLFMFGG